MASNNRITRFDRFNPSSISYGVPTANSRGGKNIKIFDSTGKQPLVLQTPLILTWGINKLIDESTGNILNYNLAIQFPTEQYETETTSKFYTQMKEFENKILNDCVKNSKDWFGKSKFTRDIAEALFTPMLRYPKLKDGSGDFDYSKGATLRVKIPFWDGKIGNQVELYDMNHKLVYNKHTDLSERAFESFIPKGSHVALAIQCGGIWFANGKFGVTWRLQQGIVREPFRLQGRCFVELTDADITSADSISRREAEAEAAMEVSDELTSVAAASVSVDVADSSDSEDDEPLPPKKPVVKRKKRRVVKKKTTS